MCGKSADWLEMVEDVLITFTHVNFILCIKKINALFNPLTVTELNISSTWYEGSSNVTPAGKVQGLHAPCHLVFVQKMALQACSKNPYVLE